MAGDIKVGTYEGTGAAINIELGWVPDYVRVVNTEDGDAIWEWFNGLGAGDAIFEQSIDDDGTSGNSSLALISSNGIDAYEPTDFSKKLGFTVGTALSENEKTFRYIALRSGEY